MNRNHGMRWLMDNVAEFHVAMGATDNLATAPVVNPSPELVRLRAKLITEEFMETLAAMLKTNGDRADLRMDIAGAMAMLDETDVDFDIEAVADGIADSIYVLVGAALAFGIPLDRVWSEVQRANMAKLGGTRREDGKILKPEGWQPPRIHEAIFGEAQ